MKKLFTLFLFFCFAYSNDIQKAFLVSIFSNNIENVQHKTKTSYEHRGEVLFKVALIGEYNKNTNITTKINSSNGKLVKSEALYNNLSKKIYGHELTFKHFVEEKGYFEVFIDGKIYDTKVFVK